MNLLFYIHSLSNGGAEKVLATLANELCDAGHAVAIATNTQADHHAYPVLPSVRCFSTHTPEPANNLWHSARNAWYRQRALVRIARSSQADVLITFMPVANTIGGLAARRLGIPHIVCERVHPPFAEYRTGQTTLMRAAYRACAAVTVLTEESAAWIRTHTPARCIHIIPNAVELPLMRAKPYMDPAQHSRENQNVVMWVGRLVEQKQPEHALEAFAGACRALADAPARVPQWILWMIGDGPKADSLRSLAERLGVADRVRFIPRVGNLEEFYRRADIYLSTSAFEGFPNALLEAMACGCAPITYDCPTGPSEVISSPEWGDLVPLDDGAHLTLRLGELMRDDIRRNAVRAHVPCVVEHYSQRAATQAWQSLLRAVARPAG